LEVLFSARKGSWQFAVGSYQLKTKKTENHVICRTSNAFDFTAN